MIEDLHVCRYVSWSRRGIAQDTVQLFNAHHTVQGAYIFYSQSDTPGDMTPTPTRPYPNADDARVLLFKTITGVPSIRLMSFYIGWELTDNSYIGTGEPLLLGRLSKWLM